MNLSPHILLCFGIAINFPQDKYLILLPIITSLVHARYILGIPLQIKRQRELLYKSQDEAFMHAFQDLKKELISNSLLKDYFEQEGVSLRTSKHILIENPDFVEITHDYIEILKSRQEGEENKKIDRLRYFKLDCNVRDTFKDQFGEVEAVLWFDDRSGEHGFRRLEIVLQTKNLENKTFLIYDLDGLGNSEE